MRFSKKERLFLLIAIVSLLATIVAIPFGAWLGVQATIRYINPKSVEDQFKSNLSSVKAEIQGNQDKVNSEILPYAQAIAVPTDRVADKEKNLTLVSQMAELSTADYQQLTISYYQLSASTQSNDATLYNQITSLYNQYAALNANINLLSSTVDSSLGFQGTIFPTYLEYMKERIIDLGSSTIPVANDLESEIPAELDRLS